VTPDPCRFTDPATMGPLAENRPRTYARHALLDAAGEVIPIGPDPIPLDIWRHVLDPATGRPTGFLKRERMRTLGEVGDELVRALDVLVCEKCGHERPRRWQEVSATHAGCGGEYRWFTDEYFHGPHDSERHKPVPHDFRWIACYPVTGASEGHYVHVEFVCPAGHRVADGEPNGRVVRLALGKTFRGLAHAAEMARRCAVLLGA
jgi:hypothetical protein